MHWGDGREDQEMKDAFIYMSSRLACAAWVPITNKQANKAVHFWSRALASHGQNQSLSMRKTALHSLGNSGLVKWGLDAPERSLTFL